MACGSGMRPPFLGGKLNYMRDISIHNSNEVEGDFTTGGVPYLK